ncbi:Hsp70 family protein [Nocardia terpenica]|uniref:Hsp70 family protein n=1 Tax=Nocardia terpenica TaxID=455432 RepID=A0A6G9ZE31_9NOCA|nr:Hsp70 family protein [Nocardia terpenica]QIS23253.1 Hsp70 family protein [Nocardia terpenica]
MTQGLALGITVGSSITVAVTTSGGCDEAHVHTRSPGRTPASEDFLSRVGDPVDILTADGTSIAAADLVARVIGGTVADLSPARTVAGYPAWWSRHTVDAQRAALDRAGLGAVTLVPEPIAALRRHPATAPGAAAMVVYDLGATGVSVAVVGTGPRSSLLAEPLRDAEIAGSEFDLLTMRYVLANSLGDNDFDPFDPIIESELSALRHRCKKAKEDLSGNTATTIPVRLPGTPGTVRDIRLVRDELEDLLRDPLSRSLALVHESLRRAGLSRDAVGGILLTGGGGSIPLLTELLSTEFGLPVRTAPDPAHTAARGAALLASDLLAEPTANAAPLAARPTPIAPHPAPVVPQSDSTPIPLPERNPILPPLPQQPEPRRPRTWQRATLVGGAVAVVAALTTGTLALGTSAQSTPRTTAPSTSATPAPAPTAQPAAGHASAAIAPAVGTATTHGATGAIQPTGNVPADSAGSTAPNQPAPDAPNPAASPGSPAPQPNPPAPAPAPQPNPPAPVPAPQPPTAPPPPDRPSPDLGNTLNSGLDQTGNTLGTVLQAPGRVIPHTGG